MSNLTLAEVIEKIADVDARIKIQRTIRATWTAYKRALEAEAKMSEQSPTQGEDDAAL